MRVIYTGRNTFYSEYNGKRFCFRKDGKVQDIPLAVYDSIKLSGHIDAQYVLPADNTPIDNKEVMESIIKENNILQAEVKSLTTENKRLNEKLLKKEKSDAKKK
jgi:hypothetical protein